MYLKYFTALLIAFDARSVCGS